MKTDNITQKVSTRETEKPLTILPEENLEEVTSRLSQEEEELAARLIFRTANTDIFSLKWQDLEITEDGWNIQLEDRIATLHEENINQELEKRKEENRPLLNTTTEKLEKELPEQVKPRHLKYGGLANLLQGDYRQVQIHKRTGYSSSTIHKFLKLFNLEDVIDMDTELRGEEFNELRRYTLSGGELTRVTETGRPQKIMPEENLDKLVDRFQDKRYKLATRLIYRGGLRPAEGLELTWQDLEQKEDGWKATITTGLADRTVFLKSEKLDKLLKECVEEEGKLFDFDLHTYASKLRAASNGEIQPYTLRRSRAYDLANDSRFSQKDLQAFFGWSNPEKVERYQQIVQRR
jgi:integrase